MATTTWTQTAGMISDEDVDNIETFAEQSLASKNAAAVSETNAAASASTAATQAGQASTSASGASTSASNASASASTATTQASASATSASNAATSESNAATSESNAATSASNASTSASNAATSASASEAAKDAALAALDSFDDRYLGAKATDPTLDNDGNALVSGALYYNTTDNIMKVYTGSAWVAAYASLAGTVLKVGDTMTGDLTLSNNAELIINDVDDNYNLKFNAGHVSSIVSNTADDFRWQFVDTIKMTLDLDELDINTNVTLNPNKKLTFGVSDELEISYNSVTNEAIIAQVDDGDLVLSSNAEISLTTDVLVDGSVSITDAVNAKLSLSGPISSIDIYDTGGVDMNTRFESFNNGLFIKTLKEDGTAPKIRFELNNGNGNIIFFDDANTEGVFWNAALKRLGIGTTSAATALDVNGTITATGIDVTGDLSFGTNNKAIFGTGSSLEIYGDGSNSFIKDLGAGSLLIQGETDIVLENTSGGNYFRAVNGSYVRLYHNASPKLETTATGIDVTGTVVADGLTVENTSGATLNVNTGLAGADSKILLHEGSTASPANGASIRYAGATNEFSIGVGSSVDTKRLSIARDTGDINFYATNGITQAFHWDAADESLGIGTTTPKANAGLHIQGADGASGASVNVAANEFFIDNNGNTGMTLGSATTGTGYYAFADSTTALAGGLFYDHSSDDMGFRVASGTRMTIDSSGNVGIGVTAPQTKLSLGSSVDAQKLALYDAGNNVRYGFGIATDELRMYYPSTVGGHISFGTISSSDGSTFSEKFRINSSGNLLVGTTSNSVYNDVSGTGIALNAGEIQIAGTGTTLYANRQGSDGTIIDLRKDGLTVGSIGTTSDNSRFRILDGSNRGFAVRTDGGETALEPSTTTAQNGYGSLGTSGARWKNIYLSGGVVFGDAGGTGTSTSNTLDDYEEGTWTPTADFATTSPTAGATTGTGTYVKVGKLVSIWGTVTDMNVTGASGDLKITGLPFNVESNPPLAIVIGSVRVGFVTFSGDLTLDAPDGADFVRIVENISAGQADPITQNELSDGQSDIYFQLTYRVT